ncbi:MAG: hypothetical protein ABJB05_03225 [Parafilimonas sp.]
MHSYSATDLNNQFIQQEAGEAFDMGFLSKDSNEKIKKAYPCKLYTPNFFIRIALSFLCIVCITFAAALFFLIAYSSSDNIITGVLFFIFTICYGLLEYFVKRKKYYNAGIDNTLQVFTIIFFAGIFFNNSSNQDIWICITILIPAIWLCVRFTDSFMALVAYIAFITFVCLLCKHAGEIYILYSPFIIMIMSALLYKIQRSLKAKSEFSFYDKCFNMLRIATLSGIYISCNVYVVTQLSNSIFPENIIVGKTYFITLFILNLIIPMVYILYGFLKNKIIFLRIGFPALVATVVTIFYFYPFVSGEIWFIVGGCIMIIAGYTGMRFFKNNKFGFTANSYASLNKELISAEGLITVQSAYKNIPAKGIQFGGGSSGGAGASGNW